MMNRFVRGLAGVVVFVPLALAQQADVAGHGANEPDQADARTQIYRLDFESSYETDTGPCDIPSEFSELIRGTMEFSPGGTDGAFEVRRISDVNWLLTVGDEETRISGRGSLLIGGMGPVPVVRLSLVLRWGDERDVGFDSGFVLAPPGTHPMIDLIVREVDASPCWTRIVRVAASAVPRSEITAYRLHDSSVTEQVSPDGYSIWRPLGGSFRLVPLPPENDTLPPVHEAAVVGVAWGAPASALADWPLRVQGAGIYRWGTFGLPAVVEQRLEADLTLIEGRWVSVRRHRFDSGLQPFGHSSGPATPIIDITLPQADAGWPYTEFDLFAVPATADSGTP